MTLIADELKSNDTDVIALHQMEREEQVSLRYFSIFDFFALYCGFGGSGYADRSNCHI